jgi:hypothetical protein
MFGTFTPKNFNINLCESFFLKLQKAFSVFYTPFQLYQPVLKNTEAKKAFYLIPKSTHVVHKLENSEHANDY